MKMDIETYDESGDLTLLKTVDWPIMPRIGETVVMDGPEFGDRANDAETIFEVHDIIWHASTAGYEQNPSIVLTLPPGHMQFVPKCICREEHSQSGPRCSNCNGRVF